MIKLTEFQKWVQKIYGNEGISDIFSEKFATIVNVMNDTFSGRFDDQVEDILERAEQEVDVRELSTTVLTGESSQEMLESALVYSYKELISEELEIIEEYEEELENETCDMEHVKREKEARL
jgi:hypothetical protein